MDEQDREDFKEVCEDAGNAQLIGLCEYELKQAKESEFDEDAQIHYQCADIAYSEMERRGLV